MGEELGGDEGASEVLSCSVSWSGGYSHPYVHFGNVGPAARLSHSPEENGIDTETIAGGLPGRVWEQSIITTF